MHSFRHDRCFALFISSIYLTFVFSVGRINNVEAFTAGGRPARSHHHHPSCPSSSLLKKAAEAPLSSRHNIISPHRIKPHTAIELSNNNNNEDEYDPRDNFGRSIRGLQSSALKEIIEVGDTVVCKRSLPNLGIYEDSSYEVTSIYTQSFDEETQQIVKEPLDTITTTTQNQVYMTLFSPQHHSEAVVVTPEDVGLISVREELGNAVWLAVPGFFWVFLAASFYNTYHERTGGSFGDAFWGR